MGYRGRYSPGTATAEWGDERAKHELHLTVHSCHVDRSQNLQFNSGPLYNGQDVMFPHRSPTDDSLGRNPLKLGTKRNLMTHLGYGEA